MSESDNTKYIEERILRLLAKKNEAIGWYLVEQLLRIPPEDFPSGKNVMTFLVSLNDKGMIEETTNSKGKAVYQLTSLGRNKVESLGEQSEFEP